MNEEEFLERVLNKIAKEFGYDVASTLELMFIKKEKELGQYKNNWEELKKWLNEEYDFYDKYGNAPTGYAMGEIRIILDKMKELEEKNND